MGMMKMFKPNFSATMPGTDISIQDYLILTEGLQKLHMIRNLFSFTVSRDVSMSGFPSLDTLYKTCYPEVVGVRFESVNKVYNLIKKQAITYFKEATE